MTAHTLKEKAKAVFKLGIGDWLVIIGMIVSAAVYHERRFAAIETDLAVQSAAINTTAAELNVMKTTSSILSRIEQHLTEIDRRLENLEERKP